MIGEVRDKATAELAVRAAMTGHLVFSTVHTNDSVSVLHRMVNMGVEPYMLAGVLRGAIAQRLVRKLCDHCRVEDSLSPFEQCLLIDHGIAADAVFRSGGCPHCGNSGFSGRIVIAEVFPSSEELEDLITAGVRTIDIQQHLQEKGMVRLHRDGLIKAAAGLTTIGEVEKAVLL